MLSDILPVIRWDAPQDELLDRAEDEYSALLARSFGSALACLERTDPALAAEVLARATTADAESLRRVLLAPETSRRLLWTDVEGSDGRALAVFVADALEIEEARRSHVLPAGGALPHKGRVRWSALGDCCVDTERGVWIEQPPRAGVTVDTRSPAAFTCGGELRIGDGLHSYNGSTHEGLALAKLEAAGTSLDVVSVPIARFVRRFTLVANLVADPAIDRFSSGSMNQYVGRSIFWNAHLPFVDVGTLTEGLVHEAVHSLLYMHEACRPWFPARYYPPSEHDRIVSPWSGATLPLEPFLQACFVWYALLQFWRTASVSSAFSGERAEAGLVNARAGFLKGPLTVRVASQKRNIAPEVLDLIDEMQDDVTSSPGEV